MHPRHVLILLLACLSTAALARGGSSSFDEVVAAERAFAQASREHGLRAAFVRFMVDDTVIYRPGPVAGRAFYAKAPEATVDVDWAPELAAIAASGDLGFTTGPYRIVSKTDPTKLVVAGHYLSVWQRDDKGELHNVIDLGVEHAEQPLGTHVARQGPALITAQRLTPAAFNARLQTLLSADRMLAARLAASEGQAALATVAESEAIMLRDGSGPVEIGHAKLDAQPLPRMDLAAIRLSKAGDMGATSGWNGDPKARRAYTRVWRWTADGWRVVADVLGG